MDRFRRHVDHSDAVLGVDTFTEQAPHPDLIPAGRALDRSREDPKVVERYGKNDPTYQRDGAPKMVQKLPDRETTGGSRRESRLDELQPLGLAWR